MKILAIIGTPQKKHTYRNVQNLFTELSKFGDVETETLTLSDYNLKSCTGCKVCLDKGEELCPLKDDRDAVLKKIEAANGIVWATPNYTFQVSGIMKIFLDRLGFICHRPKYFGKVSCSIVTQGVFGGGKIVEYLKFISKAIGFNSLKGIVLTTREPVTERIAKSNEKKIKVLAEKFYKELNKKHLPTPSLFELMIFRMSRTSMGKALDDSFRDYRYYKEMGWFQSPYYYETNLNPVKKVIANIFDLLALRMAG